MAALVVLFIRLMVICMVLAVRLMYWMIKAIIMLTAAVAASIGSSSAARQRRLARR